MTERRKGRLTKQRFHNLAEVRETFQDWFDIDISKGIAAEEQRFTTRMFLRRHVHEHNGGQIDQQYLAASGDGSVRIKQHVHETRQDMHKLIGLIERLAAYLHYGFHELLRPERGPTKNFERKQSPDRRLQAGHRVSIRLTRRSMPRK